MKIYSVSQNQYNTSLKARAKFSLTAAQRNEIIKRISNPMDYTLEAVRELKKGSIGAAYMVALPMLPALAIKTYTKEDEHRNADIEAAALENIPEYCKRTQRLVDVFPINGRNAMVSTFVYGYDLGKRDDNISSKLFDNILDELFAYEKSGMVFYDFSGANIKVKQDEPSFFDFEHYKKQPLNMPAEDSWNDSNHMARNIFYPRITNIASFEIRTVGKVLSYLERKCVKDGEQRGDIFTERYLKSLSKYYERTAELYEQEIPESVADKKKIVDYEKTLARIFKNPNPFVVQVEKNLMRLRELTTEKHFRNDPKLPHDELLYQDAEAYKDNLVTRFWNIENILNILLYQNDDDLIIYAEATKVYLENMKKCWLNNN